MTERYTAADFANAQFAEHPDGRTARRIESERGTVFAWSMEHKGGEEDYCADEHLAAHGWVPVPTKPTITQSRFDGEFDPEWRWNVVEIQQKLEKLGIEIIPDPEPTNTERLAELVDQMATATGVKLNPILFAKHLDNHGVTAPNVKGN